MTDDIFESLIPSLEIIMALNVCKMPTTTSYSWILLYLFSFFENSVCSTWRRRWTVVQISIRPWFWGHGSGAIVLGPWFWGPSSGALVSESLVLGQLFWGHGSGVLVLGPWFWGSGSGALVLGPWFWVTGSGALVSEALVLGPWRFSFSKGIVYSRLETERWVESLKFIDWN
jgi:hypothetical protein